MLAFLAILVLLFVPLILFVINLVRRNFAYSWLISVFGAGVALLLMLLTGYRLPQFIVVMKWWPLTISGDRPFLLIDQVSWPLALSLILLSLAAVLTAVVQSAPGDWRTWGGILALTGLGLTSVLAGNPISLALAWVSLDLIESVILLTQVNQREALDRIIISFAGRIAGIVCIIWAGMIANSAGRTLGFSENHPQATLLLLLAGGLRLGVLPLHVPLFQEIPLRRGVGTVLRLVPVAASLILVIRVASFGSTVQYATLLCWLAAISALYGGWNWLVSQDELSGRPFWILALAAFSIISALLGKPAASLAWGLACLLPGGMLFLFSTRHRNLLPVILLGLFSISGLPFSPTWSGTGIFTLSSSLLVSGSSNLEAGNPVIPLLFSFVLIISQALLIAGYARHAFQGSEFTESPARWIWLIYPTGLLVLPLGHLLISWRNRLDWLSMPLEGWLSGGVVCGLAAIGWLVARRVGSIPASLVLFKDKVLSLDWFYRCFKVIYRFVALLLGSFTSIMEGEAGILWALVLLALLFTILAQQRLGG